MKAQCSSKTEIPYHSTAPGPTAAFFLRSNTAVAVSPGAKGIHSLNLPSLPHPGTTAWAPMPLTLACTKTIPLAMTSPYWGKKESTIVNIHSTIEVKSLLT